MNKRVFMLYSVYIKNFKAYQRKTIPLSKDNLIIGENDCGKSSILEALDIFFNKDKIEKELIRDPDVDVELGILVKKDDGTFESIKKKYKGKTGKFDSSVGDLSLIENVSYVFIPSNSIDVKKLISDLAIAKAKSDISEDLKIGLTNLYENSINSVLRTIDGRLMVINPSSTSFTSTTTLKLESGAKYEVLTSGVPLDGRGSGFKKTVVYSLLTKMSYENVIIGIDEIENSLSNNNAISLITSISSLFSQSLITTHSVHLMSSVNSLTILPILNGTSAKTVGEMVSGLGHIGGKPFILVEGKTDMVWINKVLELVGKSDEYIVIQCGGSGNIKPVKDELVLKGIPCFSIKDGDAEDADSLSKECIELYIPLSYFNSIFGLSESEVPSTKTGFFAKIKSANSDLSEDSIKQMISLKVNEFLNDENQLIEDVKHLLSI